MTRRKVGTHRERSTHFDGCFAHLLSLPFDSVSLVLILALKIFGCSAELRSIPCLMKACCLMVHSVWLRLLLSVVEVVVLLVVIVSIGGWLHWLCGVVLIWVSSHSNILGIRHRMRSTLGTVILRPLTRVVSL